MVFPPTARIVEGEIVGSKTTRCVSFTTTTNNNRTLNFGCSFNWHSLSPLILAGQQVERAVLE